MELRASAPRSRGLGAGADDPLQAIDDELRTLPADEIVLVLRPETRSSWLEEAVVERARRLYDVPITDLA